MSNREPVQIVELDMDFCSLTYGTSPCLAVLGTTGVRKCYNTFATCQSKPEFTKSVKTLKFISPRVNAPKGETYFPTLMGVSAFSSTVNIAGSDDKLGFLGKRATVSVKFTDFPYGDTLTDNYVAGRKDGTAQTDEGGYDPKDRGTFFTKLKARWPYYAGRPMRVIDGYIDGGVLTNTQTRHFIITSMSGPDDNGNVTFEGKDILALADDKKATCPKASRGKLGAAIAVSGGSFDLTPAGIGSEYAASGFATIGSEVVAFTRSGDTITLTQRGAKGTVAATHAINDSFQEVYDVDDQRIDDVIYDLLVNYANVDPAFIDTAAWDAEITKWMDSTLLTTTITKPVGVTTLVGELAVLGISIWWDEVGQKIGLLATHPPEVAPVKVSDRNNILAIEQEDRDEDRLTQVHFYSKQTDPTKDVKDKSNYNQIIVTIDSTAESVNAYDDTRIREVFCRWVNTGAESILRALSVRLLKRFNSAPIHYSLTLDAKDRDISLTDVLLLNSRIVTDETGKPIPKQVQVIKRSESKSGHEIQLTVQSFQYDGKYGKIMENGSPVYSLATAEQKLLGGYIVNEVTLRFPDGGLPYSLI